MPDVPRPAASPSGSGLVTNQTEVIGDVTVVHVIGEVDMNTAEDVAFAVDRALSGGASTVVLDLTGVGFFASSGLQLLVRFHARATARNVTLALVASDRAVLRPMEVTGLLVQFSVFSSVAEAVASQTLPAPRTSTQPADRAATDQSA